MFVVAAAGMWMDVRLLPALVHVYMVRSVLLVGSLVLVSCRFWIPKMMMMLMMMMMMIMVCLMLLGLLRMLKLW
jgi:hypothetical protein